MEPGGRAGGPAGRCGLGEDSAGSFIHAGQEQRSRSGAAGQVGGWGEVGDILSIASVLQ